MLSVLQEVRGEAQVPFARPACAAWHVYAHRYDYVRNRSIMTPLSCSWRASWELKRGVRLPASPCAPPSVPATNLAHAPPPRQGDLPAVEPADEALVRVWRHEPQTPSQRLLASLPREFEAAVDAVFVRTQADDDEVLASHFDQSACASLDCRRHVSDLRLSRYPAAAPLAVSGELRLTPSLLRCMNLNNGLGDRSFWLNESLINFYLGLLHDRENLRPAPQILFLNTWFFRSLANLSDNHPGVRTYDFEKACGCDSVADCLRMQPNQSAATSRPNAWSTGASSITSTCLSPSIK